MKKNKTTPNLLMFCLLALMFLPACGSDSKTVVGSEKNGPVIEAKNTATARKEMITQWYDAVGTIRPKTETSIEAQVPAQITKILITPGTVVNKGDTIIILDNRQFTSRLESAKEGIKAAQAGREQANQALVAAKANFAQAESEYTRVKKYFETQAATSQQLEQAKASFITAEAGVKRAQEALLGSESGIKQANEGVIEATIALGYTVIKAPDNGEILKRMAEPGDMALPGKPLAIMRTSGSLRIEAYVREGLITKVSPGAELDVEIKTLNTRTKAIVDEVVPYADPRTRTFMVKAQLPDIPGIYPGMYGKLLIPVMESEVITIPAKAVKTVGQIQLVLVREGETWITRYIKAGMVIGDRVEVLSGLNGTETVGY
ncbi:MAG: efflux RND transporter periplasmic adaptor subunit [Proteobacteria bacterium]|nr:efflux RND transporter periplasmic adaptor subunit [Pseudomonadota bacterium]